VAPFYVKDPDLGFSPACVRFAREAVCSTCDPLLGSGVIDSFCEVIVR
jgi:hypothetical protein